MRPDDEIKGIIESAFLPLKCVTTVDNAIFPTSLKFEVFDGEKLVLLKAGIPMRELRNDTALRLYLSAAREQLLHECTGLPQLDAWTFPPDGKNWKVNE